VEKSGLPEILAFTSFYTFSKVEKSGLPEVFAPLFSKVEKSGKKWI